MFFPSATVTQRNPVRRRRGASDPPEPPTPPLGDVAIPDGSRCAVTDKDGGLDCHGGSDDEPNRSHCADARPPPPSSSYGDLLGFDSVPLTDSEKVGRIITALAKGFSIGADLKGGLALFLVLVRLRRRR